MTNRVLKNILFFHLLSSAVFVTASCGGKSASEAVHGGFVTVYDTDSSSLEQPTQLWHVTEKRLCILFGYGYNDQAFIDKSVAALSARYGNHSDGGLIYPLVFPDDFKRGNRSFVTEMVNLLEGKDICGIIILGAPEGTHVAVARMQDEWGGALPYPVFSLFPQDDILGIEDSSDFVIDKAQKVETDGMLLTESEQPFVEEVPVILENLVKYMLMLDGPLEKNAALFGFVKNITAPLKIGRYTEPDSGLLSVNHFVLE